MKRAVPADASPGDPEAGLTLIELIVTVVLTGIVMSGVAAAMVQALKIPAEGQARSLAANSRTFASMTMSDDIANATIIETLASAEPSDDPNSPNTYYVDSTCSQTAKDDPLFKLTWADRTEVAYRLQYTADIAGYGAVELQRSEGGGDWEALVSGFCAGSEGVLDVLTITAGADGEPDEDTGEAPWYVGRRVRAQFHFRDTRSDEPTPVYIEASPRTDCRAAGTVKGVLDPTLPNCEHVES